MTEQTSPARVVITDIDISFGSLVNLMIKFALASIPGGIIVGIIYFVIIFFFSGLLTACGYALGGF